MNFKLIPERTALINVDLQNCFVDGMLAPTNGIEVLDQVNRLAAVCRSADILVVHTSHTLRPDGSNAGILRALAPEVVDSKIFNKGEFSSALHSELHVDEGDILLEKPRFGAFHGTDLELILRGRSIDTVIISGIATNVCCDTTAREAMVRDFRVFFLSDATGAGELGGVSEDEIRKATLATMGTLFAEVITSDEIISMIRNATGTKD